MADPGDHASAALASPASADPPASHARLIQLLLYRPACVGVGILGTRLVAHRDVGRHPAADLHLGGGTSRCANGAFGIDFDARLDATLGQPVATIASQHLFH